MLDGLRNARCHALSTLAAAPLLQECHNWFSCTFPTARFTTSFFACRIVGDERHHILNREYVVRCHVGLQPPVPTVAASSTYGCSFCCQLL